MSSTNKTESEFAPRTLLARFIGTFGMLFLTAAIYGIINKPEDWKYAAGMAIFGILLITFTISLLKSAETPMAVHLNRAVFFAYALFFGMLLWRSRQMNSVIVLLVAIVLILLAIAGLACSFSRALPARWILAALQIGIAAFFAFTILRSRGPAFWGHPVAVGTWAAVTLLLVISLFGKGSNAYYAIHVPAQNAPHKEN